MPKYLFTSDLRISDLSNRIVWAAQTELSGEQITDKSELNNAATLRFYFNLYEGTQTCIEASENPLSAIRNYIQKFQFPNTRTLESFNDSLNEKMLFAPYRVIITLLYTMALKDSIGESYLTQNEILYFLFCNPKVYQSPIIDYSQLIQQIESSREKNVSHEDFISKELQWNQYERQSREMINVLKHSSKCFELKKGILSFSLTNLSQNDEKDFIDSILKYKYMWVPSDSKNYKLSQIEYTSYMDTANTPYNVVEITPTISTPSLTPSTEPLQQIFYGAPGTGKSYKIDEATKQAGSDYVFRTTFHPDSDYSTFVGAYKPTMVMATRYGLNGSTTVPYQVGGKDLMENRIEYRFVKQAFTKAYIKAWKEFMNAKPVPPSVSDTLSIPNTVELIWRNQKWVLLQVNKNYITYAKEEFDTLDEFKRKVLEYWGKMPQPDAKGRIDLQKGAPFVPTACMWYYKKCVREGIDVTTKTADECLRAIMGVLESGGTIVAAPNTKSFSITLREDVVYYLSNEDKHAYRDKIKETYNNVEHEDGSNVRASIAKKLADYEVEFDVAWDRLAQEVNGASDDEVSTETPFDLSNVKPVYLIIEEINRGNCAQIFGDLFQLLDRSDYGFSCYPILSDEDIRQCLTAEDKNDDPSFGVNGLSFTEEQAALINSALKCDADDDVAEKIAQGEVLVLPPNLHIWATMNTSDQSLFPIDSAFKRRWDWTYVKITDGKKDWKVKGDGYSCDWWTFVQEMNKKIASATRSDDKKLGYFFCKPKQGNTFIDESTFVGKVIFYLWNDVFKDNDYSIFKVNASNGDPTFDDFYKVGKDGKIVPDSSSVKQFLINVVGQENMTINGNAPQDQEQEQQSSTLSIEE